MTEFFFQMKAKTFRNKEWLLEQKQASTKLDTLSKLTKIESYGIVNESLTNNKLVMYFKILCQNCATLWKEYFKVYSTW